MPYVIESIDSPSKTDLNITQWAIEINYYDEFNDSDDHYEVISVYGSTLNLCLLRAKTICDALNATEFEESIAILNGFKDAKDNS